MLENNLKDIKKSLEFKADYQKLLRSALNLEMEIMMKGMEKKYEKDYGQKNN